MIADGAVFENGVYKGRKPDSGRINKDSYEAVWERHEGRDLEFPAPRYRWVLDRARPGIATKHLGTFTELRTAIGFLRLLPGAGLTPGRQTDAELRYLLEGSVNYGGASWPAGTYFFLPSGAASENLATQEGAPFFTITLPMIGEAATVAA